MKAVQIIWFWLSPRSPLTPAVAGAICAALMMLGVAVVAPPLLWALGSILIPWWHWWLL